MHPHGAPLAELVLIELGHSVAAPFAGQILADLGAEVIKVEKAEDDDARHWGPPFWEGASASFQPLNRRRDSGRGGGVDVSLFETAATWMSLLAANYLASGELPTRVGSGAIGIVPYRAYATRDSDLAAAAGSDTLFCNFENKGVIKTWNCLATKPSRPRHPSRMCCW